MKNKLKGKNIFTIDKIYFALSALLILIAVIVIAASNGKSFNNLFWHGSTLGIYPDLFESVIHARTRNPYKLDAIYPAFAYCLIYFFNFFIPGKYKDNFDDLAAICNNTETLVIAHIFYAAITLAIAYFTVKAFGDSKYRGKYALVFIFITSSPFIFLIERGNTVIITIVFLFIYILYYNSQNKRLRELALICLACAAAMKLYPALFGVLLLTDKKYKEAVRAVIYGIILFVVPFAFMGGFGEIPQMLKNSLTLNNNTLSGSTGFGYGFKVNATSSIGCIFDWLFAKSNTVYIKMVVYFLAGLLLFSTFYIKGNWKKTAAVSLVVILMPDFSFIYNVIYLFIPLVLFVKEIKGKRLTFMNALYMLCFVGAFAPMPYGDIFRSIGGYNNMNWGTLICSFSLLALAVLIVGEGVYKLFKSKKKLIICSILAVSVVMGCVPYALTSREEPNVQTIESIWQLTEDESAQISELYDFVSTNVEEGKDVLCFPRVSSLSQFDELENHLWFSTVENTDSVTTSRVFKKLKPQFVVVDLSNYSNYYLLLEDEKCTDSEYDNIIGMQGEVLDFLNKNDYEVVKYVKTENNRYIAVWEDGDYAKDVNFWNASGSGTQDDPYIISTAEQLCAFSDVTNCGNYFNRETVALSNDIDMSSVKKFIPIARYGAAGSFKGVFDGKGNMITNLTMEYEYNSKNIDVSNVSFINNLSGQVVNLAIENAHVKGYKCAVFVRESNSSEAAVVNCISANNVVTAKARAGIVGDKYGGIAINVVSDSDTLKAGKSKGFIAIKNSGAEIRNCYSTTSDERNYATLTSTEVINSEATVNALNDSIKIYEAYRTKANKKIKKASQKGIIPAYSQWQLKDGKLVFVK